MKAFYDWVDHRTGYRGIAKNALYEHIPGGARWRYVFGSTLVFTFMVQVVTGLFLWMNYSPSTQTAWESVYFIQNQVQFGWLLRGIHHYAAQAMVVLLVLHLLQVVIDGAYRAPREMNFWMGLILMQIVLALALTGYLLPWDQKGYWATQVATKIVGVVPWIGPSLQELVVGGKEYGHLTLTRFFALHAGVLPLLLIVFLAIHLALFRRHGIKAVKTESRAMQYFWPEQVLKDAVACLAVLVAIVALSVFMRTELTAPADPSAAYNAARPEWYFLFLFQFLKFFHGETGELIGAIVVPTIVLLVLFLMPLIGRFKVGHWMNVAYLVFIIAAAGVLTALAVREDYVAAWVDEAEYADVVEVQQAIAVDLRKNGPLSKYAAKPVDEQIEAYFDGDKNQTAAMLDRFDDYAAWRKSHEHLKTMHEAEAAGHRAVELAESGVPAEGALALVRRDPKTQGPKLFRQYCASCHDHTDAEGHGISELRPINYPRDAQGNVTRERHQPNGGPNLYRFGSRPWIAGLLDPEKIAAIHLDKEQWLVEDAPYYGNTAHDGGDMVGFVQDTLGDLDEDEQRELAQLIAALSAEAQLPYQAEADQQAAADGTLEAGREALVGIFSCTDCHTFRDEEVGDAPLLTGYASRQWTIDFIRNPDHFDFYNGNNDRMPAFAPDTDPAKNQLTEEEIGLIVDWLREDWYRPGESEEPESE